MPAKLALLIDAENISYKDLPRILEEVPRHGQLILKAVYGDWQNPTLQKWHEIAEANAFKIRHQSNAAKTKNSSDMKLIMDAMEILYRTQVDIFCLVSNDADYVALCDKIHEAKKQVIGVGNPRASEAFIRACDTFIFIGRGDAPVQPSIESLITTPVEVPVSVPKPTPTPKPANPSDIRKILAKAFAKVPCDADRWVALSPLSTAFIQVQPEFPKTSYGIANFAKLLQSMPDFVELQGDGSNLSARLKINTPAKQTPTPKPTPKPANPPDARKILIKAFAAAPKDANQWVALNKLGTTLSEVQKGFKTNTYGHATLSKLLKNMPDLVEVRGKGASTAARLKK